MLPRSASLLCLSLLIVSAASVSAQKPVLDSTMYGKWPSVGHAGISDDGRYVFYMIDNQPVGSQTLVFRAANARWTLDVPGAKAFTVVLTPDSRRAAFMKGDDSLGIVVLGRPSIEYIPQVRSFLLPKDGKGEWLAYQVRGPANTLVVRNLATRRQRSFAGVADYAFNDDGSVLVFQAESKQEGSSTHSLNWVRLADGTVTSIWQGAKVRNLIFDATGAQLAFAVDGHGDDSSETAFWYYKAGTAKALPLADSRSAGLDKDLRLERITSFSRDGSRLFVSLQERSDLRPQPDPDAVQLDVWSYTDTLLQSQQQHAGNPLQSYKAVIGIRERKVIRLEQEQEITHDPNDDVVLVTRRVGRGGIGLEDWNSAHAWDFSLVSARDGTRTLVKAQTRRNLRLSPGGRYVIYYDPRHSNYFSYAVSTGAVRNITQDIPTDWTGPAEQYVEPGAYGATGWLTDDAAVLLLDRYDIWQVDPAGRRPAINLTNGYGHRHNVVFRLATDRRNAVIGSGDDLLLAAFNRTNKDNGFYRAKVGASADPVQLTMGPYVYYAPSTGSGALGRAPVKARNAEAYLVRRMSATESPNYFWTSDFKSFTRLSDLRPEQEYNWLTTELHSWKTLDGVTAQGILYKSENFDPAKKYPVIFQYYEKKSGGLNEYKEPGVSTSNINIPWFVSRGYLVFQPDIHYRRGATGDAAVSAVVSAAQYLSRMPWVDATKMGLQGFSWGGFETNYLITRTDLFAAAITGGGFTNAISFYGTVNEGGSTWQSSFEESGFGIGASLWERPDLYIKHSPVLRADRVTTPLLMMDNKGDGSNNWGQAMEFFTALRRLGKRVWLLQYDDGGHGVWGKSAADYTIRITQFFDHYLKGAPAPKWMTRGIPARLKGVDRGLELDDEIETPGPGLVADEDGVTTASSAHR